MRFSAVFAALALTASQLLPASAAPLGRVLEREPTTPTIFGIGPANLGPLNFGHGPVVTGPPLPLLPSAGFSAPVPIERKRDGLDDIRALVQAVRARASSELGARDIASARRKIPLGRPIFQQLPNITTFLKPVTIAKAARKIKPIINPPVNLNFPSIFNSQPAVLKALGLQERRH